MTLALPAASDSAEEAAAQAGELNAQGSAAAAEGAEGPQGRAAPSHGKGAEDVTAPEDMVAPEETVVAFRLHRFG